MEAISRKPNLSTPSKHLENTNPNIGRSSPVCQSASSPHVKSSRGKNSVSKNEKIVELKLVVSSPMRKIRERKFVVAKKKKSSTTAEMDCKCREKIEGNYHSKKCVCLAYESLRVSQEQYFGSRSAGEEPEIDSKGGNDGSQLSADGYCQQKEASSPTVKRRRDKFLEEARNGLPVEGKVKCLVKAFEDMRVVREAYEDNVEEADETKRKQMEWGLPGRTTDRQTHDVDRTSSTFSPSCLFLTSENLGLEARYSSSSSWDGNQSRTSFGGRSRRNSTESCETVRAARRLRKKQPKVTSLKPFHLKTEERGKVKMEEFSKKLQAKLIEEEKQRIPIAQGLPWTTDEPECLVKPLVKENTRPLDVKLHTDVRAVERADFDHLVAEKQCMIEQYKMEKEKELQLIEEEEVRRLRKELIPKAQPMPYFDRPFIPSRSTKNLTVPKEPKFHLTDLKNAKCRLSLDDLSTYTFKE